MEGIRKVVGQIVRRGGPIQNCFLRLVHPPRSGRLTVKFRLTPEGAGEGFVVVRDEFDSAAFVACVFDSLAQLSFPAPGKTPCEVIYPFIFEL